MIHLDFLGSVLESEIFPHVPGDPLLRFRVQYPASQLTVEVPLLNGRPLRQVALVRNGTREKITDVTMEFDVREPGDLVLTSWMDLKGSSTTFRLGVKEEERGILLEESAEAHSGHKIQWFLDGEFLDYDPSKTRTIFSPRRPDPLPVPTVWDRLGGDF